MLRHIFPNVLMVPGDHVLFFATDETGGRLYALDLAGAAGGVLAATLFLIHAFGPIQMLPVLSAAAGISLLTLLRRS